MSLNATFTSDLKAKIAQLKADKVYKRLNYLSSPQSARVQMEGRGEILILSSNNYLGLCDEPSVVQAGIDGLAQYGAGTGSVRFICGTYTIHRELEQALARFVGTESSLSFVACWNANEALTATIVEAGDFAGVRRTESCVDHRLHSPGQGDHEVHEGCSRHGDLDDLVEKLRANASARRRVIWTDGVFSMEGSICKLPDLLQIARDHDAVLVMDDSTGRACSARRRGTAEHFGVVGEVDVNTSTLGKALGAAAGGFVAGPDALCDMLTQRSRPQLFSANAPPPTVAARAPCRRSGTPNNTPNVQEAPRQHRLLSWADRGGRVQAAGWRHADRAHHHRRHRCRDPDEQHAPGRRRFVTGSIPRGAAGNGPRALSDLRCALHGRSRLCRARVQEGRRGLKLV
ncbi:MAG: aminotransferase class I/II-fold pyridoxal phosphate-dependent enzyme [Gemmatimonadaceae bacterium]